MAQLGLYHKTDTDTETVALLAQHYLSQGDSPRLAAQKTVARLEGAFALAFLFHGEEDLMIAARKGSPLAIGHGDGEMYVGSDAIALAPLTDRISYMDEGDFAVLTRDSLEITDKNNKLVNRDKKITIDSARIDKAGYKHFMAKEIAEQPSVLTNTLQNYISADDKNIELPSNDINLGKIEHYNGSMWDSFFSMSRC